MLKNFFGTSSQSLVHDHGSGKFEESSKFENGYIKLVDAYNKIYNYKKMILYQR